MGVEVYGPSHPRPFRAGRGRECSCSYEPCNRSDFWVGPAPALVVAARGGGKTPTLGALARRVAQPRCRSQRSQRWGAVRQGRD